MLADFLIKSRGDMPIDPYHENMTAWGQLKKQLIALWPSVYGVVNWFVTFVFSTLIEMMKSVIRALKP